MSSYEELAEELGVDLNDPEEQLARDLAQSDDDLLEQLVELRKDRGLKQTDVAEAIGRHKSAICNFERLGADPRMSTVRRYAAAVGARVTHSVEPVEGLEHTCAGTTFEQHVVEELRSGLVQSATVNWPGGTSRYVVVGAAVDQSIEVDVCDVPGQDAVVRLGCTEWVTR